MKLNKFFSRHRVMLLLLGITAVGTCLRFFHLGKESLWNDELSTWSLSGFDSFFDVIICNIKDVHPPGYLIIMHIVEKLCGDTEFVLRFPSALCGILSIPTFFLLGREVYSEREGLIAAAMLGVLWCPIFYSQEARPYAMLLLFSALATYFLIRLVKHFSKEEGPCRLDRVGYIICSVILCYTHYFGTYLVFLEAIGALLVWLIGRRYRIKLLLTAWLIIFLAYLPWLPIMLLHGLGIKDFWIPYPEGYIATFRKYFDFLFNRSNRLSNIVLLLYAAGFLSYISGWFKRKDRYRYGMSHRYSSFILLLWLIIPFTGAYIRSVLSTPVLTYRNLIISLPAAYLLLARSITRISLRTIHQGLIVGCLVAAFLYNMIFEMRYYSAAHKEQFREAVRYVINNEPSFDKNLIIGYSVYLNYYFAKERSSRRIDLLAGKEGDIARVTDLIEKESPSWIWFIEAHRRPSPAFMRFLNTRADLVSSKKFIGQVRVFLFRVRSPNFS